MSSSIFDTWATQLQAWAIPQEILDQAPESPWIHPVSTFTPSGNLFVDTPSRLRALEALPQNGSVLDIGCGGGRAAFGLTPPATLVIGVDHQQGMLDVFTQQAQQRNVDVTTILGDWPDVETRTPIADVVVCHHVFYNVQNIAPFIRAMSEHARRRIVVEIPQHHPLSSLSALWKEFWDLERPTHPTSADAVEAIRQCGYQPHSELFTQDLGERPVSDDDVRFTRIRLCLSADRDNDIRTFLENHPVTTRELAAIWWDV